MGRRGDLKKIYKSSLCGSLVFEATAIKQGGHTVPKLTPDEHMIKEIFKFGGGGNHSAGLTLSRSLEVIGKT